MDHFVVDRPESMEIKHFLVPFSDWLHLSVRLVSHTVIDVPQVTWWKEFIEWLFKMMLCIARHESTVVLVTLDEGVDCVSVGLYRGYNHRAVLVCESLWLTDWLSSSGDCLVENSCSIINRECNIFYTVTMLSVVL